MFSAASMELTSVVKMIVTEEGKRFVYETSNILGRGANGVVYEATAKGGKTAASTGRKYVVKVIDCADDEELKEVMREVEISKRYFETHHCIEKYSDRICVYMVMERFPGDVLYHDDSKALPEALAQLSLDGRLTIIIQMLLWLNLFHRNGVVHLDIKGDNIMLGFKTVPALKRKALQAVVFDFGVSKYVSAGMSDGEFPGGTPFYMAPEILGGSFGCASDIYALSGVAGKMLGAKDVFADKNRHWGETFLGDNIKSVLKGVSQIPFCFEGLCDELTLEDGRGCPDKIKNLLLRFLSRMQSEKYYERPDVQEVLRFFVTLKKYSGLLAQLPSERKSEWHDEKHGLCGRYSLEDEELLIEKDREFAQLVLIASGHYAIQAKCNWDFVDPAVCAEIGKRFLCGKEDKEMLRDLPEDLEDPLAKEIYGCWDRVITGNLTCEEFCQFFKRKMNVSVSEFMDLSPVIRKFIKLQREIRAFISPETVTPNMAEFDYGDVDCYMDLSDIRLWLKQCEREYAKRGAEHKEKMTFIQQAMAETMKEILHREQKGETGVSVIDVLDFFVEKYCGKRSQCGKGQVISAMLGDPDTEPLAVLGNRLYWVTKKEQRLHPLIDLFVCPAGQRMQLIDVFHKEYKQKLETDSRKTVCDLDGLIFEKEKSRLVLAEQQCFVFRKKMDASAFSSILDSVDCWRACVHRHENLGKQKFVSASYQDCIGPYKTALRGIIERYQKHLQDSRSCNAQTKLAELERCDKKLDEKVKTRGQLLAFFHEFPNNAVLSKARTWGGKLLPWHATFFQRQICTDVMKLRQQFMQNVQTVPVPCA